MGRPRNIVEPNLEPETPVVTSATVRDSRGQTIRIYDFKTHGKNFEALANQFMSHHPEVKDILVR